MCLSVLPGGGRCPSPQVEVTKSGLLPLAFTLHKSLVNPEQLQSSLCQSLGVFINWAFRLPAWGSFGRLTESRTSAGNLSVVEHNSAAPVFYAVNPTYDFPASDGYWDLWSSCEGLAHEITPWDWVPKIGPTTLAFRFALSFQTSCQWNMSPKAFSSFFGPQLSSLTLIPKPWKSLLLPLLFTLSLLPQLPGEKFTLGCWAKFWEQTLKALEWKAKIRWLMPLAAWSKGMHNGD